MNKILPFILTLIFTIAFSVNSFALTLTDIGDLNITQQLSEFTYNQDDPVFKGTTTLPNSQVTLTTTTQEYITVSDTAGYWQINTISPSDSYNVTISTSDAEYSFLLNVNLQESSATTTSTTTATQTPVPETGVNQVSALFFTTGILLLAFYLYFWGTSSTTKKLEKYYLDN